MSLEAPGGILRRVIRLSLPVVALNILGVLTLFVDTLFVSRLEESESALIALSFAGQIVFLAQVPMLGLSIGSAVMVSRAFGGGERRRVAELSRQSLQATVLVGLAMAALGPPLLPPILRAIGAEGEVFDLALAYLTPLVLGIALYFVQLLSFALFRSTGNTRIPFYVGLLVNALNVFLDWVLIFGELGAPKLGVAGAAYGTLLSQAVGVTLTLLLFSRGALGGVPMDLRPTAMDREVTRDLFRFGAPASLDLFLVNFSFLLMMFFLAEVDPRAVAAHGIGQRVQGLAFVPGLGISQAVGALVGNALGANDASEARAVTRAGVMLSSATMGVIGLALTLSRGFLCDAFELAPGSVLRDYALTWIVILGSSLPIVGLNLGLVGALRGAGATIASFTINVVSTFAIQVPLQWLLAFPLGFGAFGVWIAFPIAYVFRVAFAAFVYKRGRWARVGLAV